jgi:membrane carboxypeptidase/penicillin-binding protein
LKGKTIGGTYFENAWGSEIAGPMWVDYMKVAGPKYETKPFPEFDGPSGDVSVEGTAPKPDDDDSNDDSESSDSDNENSEDSGSDSDDS